MNSFKLRREIGAVVLVMAMLWMPGASQHARADEPATQPGKVRLLLPPIIYASPGIECNLYYANVALMLNPANYAFDVVCDKGKQLRERWTLIPTVEDAGDYPLRVTVLDEANQIVASGQSILRIAPANAGRTEPISLLLIGASNTEYSIYPKQIHDLAAADERLALRFIGSRKKAEKVSGADDLRHEGYSGWTAEAFATMAGKKSRTGEMIRGETGSPFIYTDDTGKSKLDFGRYCAEFNAGNAPELVTINLATNDVFRATDVNIDEVTDAMLGHYDTLVSMIHQFNPQTRIGIVVPAPATSSQDGFRNYAGSRHQTAWQFRRNIHRAVEKLCEHFRDAEDRNIYLVPAYLNLDIENGFPSAMAPRSSHDPEQVRRITNGTHPSESGCQQIGDAIYAWIKCVSMVEPK